MRRFTFVWPMVCLAVALAGCGGGGGGTVVSGTLSLSNLAVTTQTAGPLSPFGSTSGGDTLQITGTGFTAGLQVLVGGVAASNLVVGSNSVTCTTPASAQEGFADVTVRLPSGETATMANVFQYVAPPVIFSLQAITGPTTNESRAPVDGGETIQVNGQNFKPGITGVVDGSTPVTVTWVDANTVTFTAPAAATEKAADVLLSNPEGLFSQSNGGLVYTQEFSLAQETRPLSAARARHLFRRAAFGASQAEIDAAVAAGLVATVAGLVDYVNDATVEQEALTVYTPNPPPTNALSNNPNKYWWIHLMVNNPNGFQERFAYFLHDHFAVSENGFAADFRWTLHPHIQLFRRFTLSTGQTLDDGSPGLGYDWKRICIEMGKDRAMLDWLDGRLSRVGNTNENYARELWELFMLGEGRGYTEDDIKEAARAFTGFRWLRKNGQSYLDVEYRPTFHDAGEKTILGETGFFGYDSLAPFYLNDANKDTDDRDTDGGIVALTLRRRPVEASTFICRKLAEFFLYDNIHDSVVDQLAQQLRAPGPNQWNLRPVIQTILRSKAMYSARAMKGKIKNPIEFVMGFLRSTKIPMASTLSTAATRIRGELIAIGQEPLNPPDVNGWPSGVAWLGSQAMLERTNFVRLAISQLTGSSFVDPLLPTTPNWDAGDLVAHIAAQLDVQLSGNALLKLTQYVDENGPGTFNTADEIEVRKKVRGLLWLIAPYHDGHQD